MYSPARHQTRDSPDIARQVVRTSNQRSDQQPRVHFEDAKRSTPQRVVFEQPSRVDAQKRSPNRRVDASRSSSSPARRSPNPRPMSALEELESFDFTKPESNPKDLLKRASSQLGRLRKKRDKSDLFARNQRTRSPDQFADPDIARIHAQNLDYLRREDQRSAERYHSHSERNHNLEMLSNDIDATLNSYEPDRRYERQNLPRHQIEDQYREQRRRQESGVPNSQQYSHRKQYDPLIQEARLYDRQISPRLVQGSPVRDDRFERRDHNQFIDRRRYYEDVPSEPFFEETQFVQGRPPSTMGSDVTELELRMRDVNEENAI